MVGEWIRGIFYPFQCPFCQEILPGGQRRICASCQKKIKRIIEPRCKKCGRPIRLEEQEFCYDCRRKKHSYEEGIAVYVYEGRVRRAVHQMKFQNRRVYAEIFGAVMAEEVRKKIELWDIKAVVPVPMYKKKQRERGYNQAELLARKVSDVLHIEMKSDLVVRVRDTKPQKELEKKDRENNLKKAFSVKQNEVKLKNILLVDDIYTTGSTIDALADTLKKHGVEKIYFLALCIGKQTDA